VDELPAVHSLPDTLHEALQSSYALIVICSPHAAASLWVEKEIRTFRDVAHGRPVLALLVDGEPHATPGLAEAFPRALREAGAAAETVVGCQPLAADVRKGKDSPTVAKLRMIAGLLKQGFDDLYHRDRRRRRIQWLTALGISLLAAICLGAFVYETQQFVYETRQTMELEARHSEIGRLLESAREAAALSPELALLLAWEAGNRAQREQFREGDARRRIVDLLAGTSGRGLGNAGTTLFHLGLSANGRWGAASGQVVLPEGPARRHVVLWDLDAEKPADHRTEKMTEAVGDPVFDSGGRWLVTDEVWGTEPYGLLWDLRPRPPTTRKLLPWSHDEMTLCSFVRDAQGLLFQSRATPPRFWDLRQGGELRGIELTPNEREEAVLSPDGRWLAVPARRGKGVRLWDWKHFDSLEPKHVVGRFHRENVEARFAPSGSRLLVLGGRSAWAKTTASVVNLRAPNPPASELVLQGYLGGTNEFAFSPDGTRLAVATSRLNEELPGGGILTRDVAYVHVWYLNDAEADKPVALPGVKAAKRLVFAPDGRRLVALLDWGEGGLVWDLGDAKPASVSSPAPLFPRQEVRRITDAWFSANGEEFWAVAGDDRGEFLARRDFKGKPQAKRSLRLEVGDQRLGLWKISPDRKWLIRPDEKDPVAYLWSTSLLEGPLPLRGHAGKVTHIAFSADGRRLMTGAEDGSVRDYDLTVLDPSAPFPRRVAVEQKQEARRTAQSRWEVLTETRPVMVYDYDVGNPVTDEGHPRFPLTKKEQVVTAAARSRDRVWAAIAEEGGALTLWEFGEEYQVKAQWQSTIGTATRLTFDDAGRWLLGQSADRRLIAWPIPCEAGKDPATPGRALIFPSVEKSVSRFAVSPDAGAIVLQFNDDDCELWVRGEQDVAYRRTALGPVSEDIEHLDVSRDRTRLALSAGSGVRVWDNVTRAETRLPVSLSLEGHPDAVRMDADGRLVAATFLNRVHVWKLSGAASREGVRSLCTRGLPVEGVVADRTLRWLALNDSRGTLLWDLSDSSERRPEAAWASWTATKFSPDGGWLLLGHPKGYVARYPLSLDAALGLAAEAVGRSRLTKDEWPRYSPGVPYGPMFGRVPSGK
jgi:WD40 repeat protein